MSAVDSGNESDGNHGGEDAEDIDYEALAIIFGEDEDLDKPLIEFGGEIFPNNHVRRREVNIVACICRSGAGIDIA